MFSSKKFAVVGSAVMFLSVLNGVGLSALPAAQDPVTEAVITVFADGNQTSDATSGPAVPGTDDSNSNGVVKNFDVVTYEVEVSLNDADDTNWSSTVSLNDKASWTGVPLECRSVADFPSLVPDSSVSDTTGDGLNDTLVCNHGDHTEGTKLTFKPTAQAIGNNLEVIEASVVPSSDNSDPAENRSDGPVTVDITAGFGIGIDKSIVSLPEEDEIDYSPRYEPVSVFGREGKTVEWHIALSYAAGSEFVDDNGSGTQSFTIEDTWVGTHSQTPGAEGDNANGTYSDGIELKDLVTGDPLDACKLLGSNGGTVTCSQTIPGGPITIQVDDVPVNQQPLAKVSLQMFYPYDTVFPSGPYSDGQTYNIDNTAELIAWGGAGTMVTSGTGSVDPGPEIDVNGYPVSASRPGPFAVYKTFDQLGNAKSGKRAAARGEVIETTMVISDARTYDTLSGVCDTIDLDSFDFVGTVMPGGGQLDGIYHGPSSGTYIQDRDTSGQASLHQEFNPKVQVYNGTDVVGTAQNIAGAAAGISIEFSDVDYATTGDDHWTATCEDDLTGDGSSDWVADFNSFPGGADDVVRVRMTWDRSLSGLQDLIPENVTRSLAFFSFDLRIKNTAPISEYLPNTASGFDTLNSTFQNAWGPTTGGLNGAGTARGAAYFNVDDDPANSLFSFNNVNADRVYVLPASMSIAKSVVPADLGSVVAGDSVLFNIDPATSGSNADAVEMTFTDTLPNGLTYASDTCSDAYAAVGLACTVAVSGQTVTFTVPDYQVGDDLPAFEIESTVGAVAAGAYTNTVVISSDFAAFTDTAHCIGSTDSRGLDNEARCIAALTAPHTARAAVQVIASAGERIEKSDSQVVVEPQADWTNGLTYENLGGSDIGEGHLIDILSYNGDGVLGGNTERFNPASENPGNANTETVTSDADGQVEFVSVTPSTAGESFEYTTDPSVSIDHRPCHPSNWPAGDSLGSGNALLDEVCGLGLIDPATDVPTASQAGTGATDWTAFAGPDVTAVRALLPAFPAGGTSRTIELVTNVSFAQESDLLCNNFGLNSETLTLDIISNDVCVEVVAGSIGDYVWFDTNADGEQDGDEAPIAGVVVTLLDGDGDPILDENGDPLTATTDENGLYLFDQLPSGDYQVVVDTSTLPAGVSQTFDNDGGLDNRSATTLNGPATDPTLTDVDDDLDQDFGYVSGSIGDTVWFDSNGDGVQDPDEAPIPGVVINLLDGDGNPVLDVDGNPITATTDENGQYLFENLPLDDYIVEVDTSTLPPGIAQTFDNDGGLDNRSATTLSVDNLADRDQDFGYQGGSIGDTVWFDTDGDGVQDPGEPGVPGVTIEVTYLGPDGVLGGGDDVVYTTVSDENGNYLFENLPLGEYRVGVYDETLPTGVEQVYDFDGGLDNESMTTIDGDNLDDLDQDFGYNGPFGSIGDVIWLDTNGDGIQDPGEEPIAGVVLLLLDGNGDPVLDADGNPITATTNENGVYLFPRLPFGDYIVQVDLTSLPDGVAQTFGGDNGLYRVTIDADNPDDRDGDFAYTPGALAATGSSTLWFIGFGLVLMAAGVVVARRRKIDLA